jgi:hypothetical protein
MHQNQAEVNAATTAPTFKTSLKIAIFHHPSIRRRLGQPSSVCGAVYHRGSRMTGSHAKAETTSVNQCYRLAGCVEEVDHDRVSGLPVWSHRVVGSEPHFSGLYRGGEDTGRPSATANAFGRAAERLSCIGKACQIGLQEYSVDATCPESWSRTVPTLLVRTGLRSPCTL